MGSPHQNFGLADAKLDSSIPTIFLPGYFGNRFSFGFMLNRFEKKFWAKKSMVIRVGKLGNMKVQGDLANKRSLIQVIFTDHSSKAVVQANWLKDICLILNQQFNVDSINLVGHSMGCITIFWFLTHQLKDLPIQVKRVVAIAGPFNNAEVAKNTKDVENYPNGEHGPKKRMPIYDALLHSVKNIPDDVQVLNIAGSINDQVFHDGEVSVNSAISLRYILKQTAVHYRELIVRGNRATHWKLHENRNVDQTIAKFLWNI